MRPVSRTLSVGPDGIEAYACLLSICTCPSFSSQSARFELDMSSLYGCRPP